MPVVTPLINEKAGMSQGIEVSRAGQVLSSPRVVNIELASRGRTDIRREAFDDGQPLALDVGVLIIECLDITSSPSDRQIPSVTVDGTKLFIQPSLIGRRQVITFSLLVDGATPRLSSPAQSLIDVNIRMREPDLVRSAVPPPRTILTFVVLAAAIAFISRSYTAGIALWLGMLTGSIFYSIGPVVAPSIRRLLNR
jgi:hypothetical protein